MFWHKPFVTYFHFDWKSTGFLKFRLSDAVFWCHKVHWEENFPIPGYLLVPCQNTSFWNYFFPRQKQYVSDTVHGMQWHSPKFSRRSQTRKLYNYIKVCTNYKLKNVSNKIRHSNLHCYVLICSEYWIWAGAHDIPRQTFDFKITAAQLMKRNSWR